MTYRLTMYRRRGLPLIIRGLTKEKADKRADRARRSNQYTAIEIKEEPEDGPTRGDDSDSGTDTR